MMRSGKFGYCVCALQRMVSVLVYTLEMVITATW